MSSRARQNRGGPKIGKGVDLSPQEIERGSSQYSDWHWSEKPTKVVDWGDPDMPEMLVECGKLIRVHVRAPEGARPNHSHPRRERDTMIEFSRSVAEKSHLAYDPDHPYQRLYLLVDRSAQPTLAQRFWHQNAFAPMLLGNVAAVAGGRHGGSNDYPHIMVKVIGVLTDLVYFTTKTGDGPSFYRHQLAEISGLFPFLCCDATGRLWLAGGNTTSPTQGVTD